MKNQLKKGVKEQIHRKSKSDAKKMGEELFKNSSGRTYKTNPKMRKSNYVEKIFKDRAFMHKALEGKESPLGVPPSYVMGQLDHNWIENINQQIEQNGKNLLDSINKTRQKNSGNIVAMRGKRRKSKQKGHQSNNYVKVGYHPNANDAFKSILNNQNLNPSQAPEIFNPNQMTHHNRSYNPEFISMKNNYEEDLDITDARISLHQG